MLQEGISELPEAYLTFLNIIDAITIPPIVWPLVLLEFGLRCPPTPICSSYRCSPSIRRLPCCRKAERVQLSPGDWVIQNAGNSGLGRWASVPCADTASALFQAIAQLVKWQPEGGCVRNHPLAGTPGLRTDDQPSKVASTLEDEGRDHTSVHVRHHRGPLQPDLKSQAQWEWVRLALSPILRIQVLRNTQSQSFPDDWIPACP